MDDVEYGVRARAAGFVTVTLPMPLCGMRILWKEYDDWALLQHPQFAHRRLHPLRA